LLASAPDPVSVARHARRSSDRACFAPRTTRDEVSLSIPGSRTPWGRRPRRISSCVKAVSGHRGRLAPQPSRCLWRARARLSGRSATDGSSPGTFSTPRPHERPWSTVRLLASAPDPVPVARHVQPASAGEDFAPRTTRDEVSLSIPGSRTPWGRRPRLSARA
jgi:hypothetical protein